MALESHPVLNGRIGLESHILRQAVQVHAGDHWPLVIKHRLAFDDAGQRKRLVQGQVRGPVGKCFLVFRQNLRCEIVQLVFYQIGSGRPFSGKE